MLANSGLNTTEPIPKENTRRAYAATLSKFISDYGHWTINDLTSDEALLFLNKFTEGNKPQTKKIRYAHLSSFFNFIRNNIDQEFRNPDDRVFPISYEAARIMVINSGKMVGIHLRPHDLRRHSATYASRSGVPIEIVSKDGYEKDQCFNDHEFFS
jgi:integrase